MNMSDKERDKILATESGIGDMPIDCPNCGGPVELYMDHDIYICQNCGGVFTPDEMPDEEYDDDNPPFGCAACGGPWPHCKDSCNLFD